MKNILARGGIEFLAVLLGITGSLYIDNKDRYVEDIWFSIKNSFKPDLSTYETLLNSGEINIIDFETIKLFGKLHGFIQEIHDVQKKELVARDFVEQRFLLEHSQYFKKYSMPYDLLEFYL